MMGKPKIILFVWMYMLSMIVMASVDQAKIDSFDYAIELASNPEIKTDLLIQKARYAYYELEQELTLEYANEAIEFAKSTKNTELYAATILDLILNNELVARNFFSEYCATANGLKDKITDVNLLTQMMDCAAYEIEDDTEFINALKASLQKKIEAGDAISDESLFISYFKIGGFYTDVLAFDSVEYYFNEAKKVLDNAPQNVRIKEQTIELNISNAYQFVRRETNTDTIQFFLEEALAMSDEIGSRYQRERALNMRANLYHMQRDFAKAMENRRAIIANRNSPEMQFADYADMGYISSKMDDHSSAKDYFEKAVQLSNEMGLAENSVILYNHLAQTNRALNKEQAALDAISQAEQIVEEHQFNHRKGELARTKGEIYFHFGAYEKSIPYMKEALAVFKKQQNEMNIVFINESIAKSYSELGNKDSLDKYIELPIKDAKAKKDFKNLYECYYTKYRLGKQIKDDAYALENLEQYKIYKDSLDKQKLLEQLAKERVNTKVVEAKGEANKAQKEVAAVTKEAALLATQKKLYSLLAFSFLGILALGTFFFFRLRRNKVLIESQNTQLQNLNATKDKFFGIIAHDIRSPIVALEGVEEQMDYYLKKDKKDKLQKLAGKVGFTAKKLSGLLDNLLNWALLQQGVIPYHPQAINMKATGEHVMMMFQENADTKNINLKMNIDENIEVFADESALQTILRNLVSNAIKFTPENGEVSLSTSIQVGKVFIEVNDTGTGIAAEKLDNLYNFDTASQKGTKGEKGTGLGLNLVKELVELNKGILEVNSKLNVGSTFIVALPMQ